MHRLLHKILDGRAAPEDLTMLEKLCDMVKHTSLCGLGQTAPNPVLSTLRYFRGEYTGRLQTSKEELRRRLPDGRAVLPGLHRRRDGARPPEGAVRRRRPGEEAVERLRLATTWLQGCSGCHMSFLDLDEFLTDLADRADVVYTPVMDAKEYPDNVDVVLIEGAVATEEQIEHARAIRERTKLVISFGDCAVTGNVTSLRNPLGKADVILRRSYLELATIDPQ